MININHGEWHVHLESGLFRIEHQFPSSDAMNTSEKAIAFSKSIWRVGDEFQLEIASATWRKKRLD